jgi:uncharacterized repeat protein (TIGR03803 family)
MRSKAKSISLRTMIWMVVLSCVPVAIPSPAQILTSLHSFDGTDGSYTLAGLVQGNDGNFYGTTYQGGANCSADDGCGTVYKITPGGALTTLYNFCTQTGCADGKHPQWRGLVQASDGNFYGTTGGGGANSRGTVFKITPSGALTTLWSFCSQPSCPDGFGPDSGLVQASDGNFYGTTIYGGAYTYCDGGQGCGTVFKITPSGVLTTIHSFNGGDGNNLEAGLVQASDGNFYGTTAESASGLGTVYKITSSGELTTLHVFNGTDGAYPAATPIQGSDGNLYGTTYQWGQYQYGGTVFRITPGGTLTTLHFFAGPEGRDPEAGLLQATDGNFYGTAYGGAYGFGTIFRITPLGVLSTVHNFSGADGAGPRAALIQATDGNSYGTTFAGGTNGLGTVFRLVLPAHVRPCVFCQ